MSKYSLPILVLFVVVAGCTLEPKYSRPVVPLSKNWPPVPGHPESITAASTVPVADLGWREFFRDQRLQQLVGLALTNNPNLLAAVWNVEQTKDIYHVQRSALIPTGNIDATGSRQRIPNVFTSGQAFTYGEYTVEAGLASYEVDLFGRVRSLTKQALETYFATEETRKSAQIALVAQVATAYLTEREAEEQLTLAQQIVNTAQQAYDLTRRSFEGGVSSQLDLDSAAIRLQTAKAAVAGYQQQLAQARDNLVLLIGCPLPDNLAGPEPFDPQICLADIPPGLPSDLLQRRPDVLAAEHQLKAINANIGAARAAFFPTITLTGSAGTASTTLEGLFAPGSQTWAISPQIVWPIFSAGTAWAQLKTVKAGDQIAAANYRGAVQTAFREVADGLAGRTTLQQAVEANQALVEANQKTYDLTEAGFQNGINSTLDTAAAEENLDTARQNLVQSQYSRLFNLINLYQALGGGWEESTTANPPSKK